MIIYLLAGISDMADGFLARKMKTANKFGATLDSVADAILIFCLLILFIPYFVWPFWIVGWILLIALIRFASLIVAFFKFRAIGFLHTYSNKITGFFLFCFPALLWLFGLHVTAIVLCTLASLSAMEELSINIFSRQLDRNITSIFAKPQSKKIK